MASNPPTEPITIRAATDMIREIDALAATQSRSRNYIVVQAMRQYLDANAWQIERIEAGVAAAREGNVETAEAVFDGIAARHGWAR